MTAKVLQQLMNKYDTYRAKWIDFHGTADGFDAWFSTQVPGVKDWPTA